MFTLTFLSCGLIVAGCVRLFKWLKSEKEKNIKILNRAEAYEKKVSKDRKKDR